MFMQTKLKKRDTTTKVLKAAPAASAVSTNEENVVDEFEPAAFSTLIEEGSKAINKPLDVMAPFCCIYDV